MAGLAPSDVDFVTLYDNFPSMVIQQLEDMGFCRRGEGGPFVDGGRIALGGELPVNERRAARAGLHAVDEQPLRVRPAAARRGGRDRYRMPRSA
jgi:acetyl-CoA acetyltransferase